MVFNGLLRSLFWTNVSLLEKEPELLAAVSVWRWYSLLISDASRINSVASLTESKSGTQPAMRDFGGVTSLLSARVGVAQGGTSMWDKSQSLCTSSLRFSETVLATAHVWRPYTETDGFDPPPLPHTKGSRGRRRTCTC